jgi:hypothetical protein
MHPLPTTSDFRAKSLLQASGLQYDDDPYEPMAENEVDFQPLRSEVFPGLTRRPAFKREGLDTESGGLGTASSRLEIRPEHQHKTVNTRQPSLTFISPPSSEEELRVHSSLLQVRLHSIPCIQSRYF